MSRRLLATRGARVDGYLVAAVAVALVATWLTVVIIDHRGQPVYDMPPLALAWALTAAALAVAGAAGLVVVRRHDAALLSALVTLLILGGVLAIFSVGLLFLVAGVGMAFALARRWSGSGPWPIVSGVAMASGIATAALIAVQPPVVRCSDRGTSTSSAIWSSSSQSSGSSSSGPAGVTSGTVSQGGRTFEFTCHGKRLVEFQTVPDG